MNTIACAQKKITTPLVKTIARSEHQESSVLLNNIAAGKTVILKNRIHHIEHPCAVGKGLRTKVNVNIGSSTDLSSISLELKKLRVSIEYGADTVMDLSVGKHSREIRKSILKHSSIPLGTVPIYEAAQLAKERKKDFLRMTKDDILEVIRQQAEEGVDFFTIHAGVRKEIIKKIPRLRKRIVGIVSRGGALLARWIRHNDKENPMYEYFDEILKIAKQYDITLSLGDGLRPGSILDATDSIQLYELRQLGMLAKRARAYGVQIIIEGPGHVPLHQIQKNIRLQKKLCNDAPFYVLGPLVTDVASGYDHIAASIGGALASFYGADFLCYVTPAEHLKLPSIDDVKEGLIASKIAAHAADVAKGVPHQIDWDAIMSKARKQRDWQRQIKLSIDPKKALRYRLESKPKESSACTMCGEYCSLKVDSK